MNDSVSIVVFAALGLCGLMILRLLAIAREGVLRRAEQERAEEAQRQAEAEQRARVVPEVR